MTLENLKSALETLKIAIEKLSEALNIFVNEKDRKKEDVLFDAAVKRFETAFEYAWKLMQTAVDYEGSEALGPRSAISEAIHYGWIENPQFWSNALDARNGSVHNYFGIPKDDYFEIMKKFVTEVEEVMGRIRRISNQ